MEKNDDKSNLSKKKILASQAKLPEPTMEQKINNVFTTLFTQIVPAVNNHANVINQQKEEITMLKEKMKLLTEKVDLYKERIDIEIEKLNK